MTFTARFDELEPHQRLTLFTFAILSQGIQIDQKEAVAEGLFQHLYDMLTLEEEVAPLPLLAVDGEPERQALVGILSAEGHVAPIVPFDSEFVPLLVHPLATTRTADKNPYTILGARRYGEEHGDGPRRLIVLGRIDEEKADYFGTEPMMIFLDFDLAEEDAPALHELPSDLGDALAETLQERWIRVHPSSSCAERVVN